MKFYLTLIFLWLAVPAWAAPLRVVVATPPQAFVIGQIGGGLVQIQTLVGRGQDPHDFEPTPRQIMPLGQAVIMFTTGLPFEKRLVGQIKARNKNLRIVDLTLGLPLHTAADGDIDPHIWLSPPLLQIRLPPLPNRWPRPIAKTPRFISVILQLSARNYTKLTAVSVPCCAPMSAGSFYVFHPAFGYFGAAYGLRQKTVERGAAAQGRGNWPG